MRPGNGRAFVPRRGPFGLSPTATSTIAIRNDGVDGAIQT
jgi:hypothetical protein